MGVKNKAVSYIAVHEYWYGHNKV